MLNSDPYKTRVPGPCQSETGNSWAPIGLLPLSIVGETIDLRDRKRLYSGVTVAGIHYERDAMETRTYGDDPIVTILEQVSEFRIVTTTADIRLATSAEWRHHD